MLHFGTYARQQRARAGLTLRTLARIVELAPTYLWDIERGRRNPPAREKLHLWADALNSDRAEFERLALFDREAVEIPLSRQGTTKDSLAVILARQWEGMSEEEAAEIMKQLEGGDG